MEKSNRWSEPARISENSSIIAFNKQLGSLANERSRSIWDIDRYVLHSHPDVTEWMVESAIGIVPVQVALFGFSALAHPNGIIFAVAYGTSVIALRLPVGERPDPTEEYADFQLPDGWVGIQCWVNWLNTKNDRDRMTAWIDRAYAAAAGNNNG